MPDRVRLDKWLWAARLYKTRSLAAQAIDLGRDYPGVVWHIRKLSRRPRWLRAINQASSKFQNEVFYERVFSDAR